MPAYRTVDDIFLGDVEFWQRPVPEIHEAFAALRAETRRGGGMCFHEEVTVMGGDSAGPGITGPPERLQSNFINGIKRMPCEFTVR